MGLLELAREAAEKQRQEQETRKREEERVRNALARSLARMTELVLDELKKLDGQSCRYGMFKLDLSAHGTTIARITCEGIPHVMKVAWFKAAIVSDTRNMSDDCRNESYTEAWVSAHIYSPYNNCQVWNEGGQVEVLSYSSPEEVSKFFARCAPHLGAWL